MAGPFLPRATARDLVLSPQEPLVAGGPAEQLEQLIQTSFKQGAPRVLVDLRGVADVDSAGIRALVRGHTSAERLGRHFALVAANTRVRESLHRARLDQVLTMRESLAHARARAVEWGRVATAVGVTLVGVALVLVGYLVPDTATSSGPSTIPALDSGSAAQWSSPLFELGKLGVAAVVGMLVTIVQRYYRADRTPNPTLEQAQVLLCVSGALMMIIIGSSLPRAFGIAGAASIIRFRTPVEDARDITVLFLMMGLGMAAGLGGFAVAGLGTLFLCAMFPVLQLFASARPRQMVVEIVSRTREFPLDHVQKVFALNRIVFEPREIEQGDEATVRYLATLGANDSLEDLSQQLLEGGNAGLKNVSWSPPKRG